MFINFATVLIAFSLTTPLHAVKLEDVDGKRPVSQVRQIENKEPYSDPIIQTTDYGSYTQKTTLGKFEVDNFRLTLPAGLSFSDFRSRVLGNLLKVNKIDGAILDPSTSVNALNRKFTDLYNRFEEGFTPETDGVYQSASTLSEIKPHNKFTSKLSHFTHVLSFDGLGAFFTITGRIIFDKSARAEGHDFNDDRKLFLTAFNVLDDESAEFMRTLFLSHFLQKPGERYQTRGDNVVQSLARDLFEMNDTEVQGAMKGLKDDMYSVYALPAGFNVATFRAQNPALMQEFTKERGAGKTIETEIQDFLYEKARDSILGFEEKGYSWRSDLPRNFDWLAFEKQNPGLEARFIAAQAKNGLREGNGLTDGKITGKDWLAKKAAFMQAIAAKSMKGLEGYSWLPGVQNFNWKKALTPALQKRYRTAQLKRTAAAKASGDFNKNPGDYIQEKDFNPDGSLKANSGFLGRQGEWVQRVKKKKEI